MNVARTIAVVVLAIVCLASTFGVFFVPSYSYQFRELPGAGPTRQHPLGTDELGRDRLARVLYGTRISLLLAPAAALLSSILAGLIGGTAGYLGGWAHRLVMSFTDLFLSLPWFFLLITVRALLPLNTSPLLSVVITFGLLGCLGWAGTARVVCADANRFALSEFMLQARASGASPFRLLWRQLLPNLRPILLAQFWISVPVFILTEANLGILGLGVSEPLPSWGSLLRELEGFSNTPLHYWHFLPLILFITVVSSFHLVLTKEESSA